MARRSFQNAFARHGPEIERAIERQLTRSNDFADWQLAADLLSTEAPNPRAPIRVVYQRIFARNPGLLRRLDAFSRRARRLQAHGR